MAEPTILKLLSRYWAKVDRRGNDDCWPWKGASTSDGYGQIASGDNGKTVQATHVALAAAGIAKPDGATLVLQSCGDPRCVNPNHLRWAAQAEKSQIMVANGNSRAGRPGRLGAKGETSPRARLTDEAVRMIRSSPETTLTLADRLGVSNQTISLIRLRKRWSHID